MSDNPAPRDQHHNKPTAGYGYGYGYYPDNTSYYGDSQDESPQRGLKDYLLIFRERFWYILVVFLLFFSGVLIYTLTRTEIYEARATVQLLRQDATVMQVEEVMPQEIRSQEDFNTQIRILESARLIKGVASRLTEAERNRFMQPFEEPEATGRFVGVEQLLFENRQIVPGRMNLVVEVRFRHPDRDVAMMISNYFVDEYISYNLGVRIDESMRAVDDLRVRAEEQRNRLEQSQRVRQQYISDTGAVSVDRRADIALQKLTALNMRQVDARQDLRLARTRWNLIQRYQDEGRDLTNIRFIADQAQVAGLLGDYTQLRIQQRRLAERYRERHPNMIDVMESLSQTELALDEAVEMAVAKIESEYLAAQSSFDDIEQQLQEQTDEIQRLNDLRVEYDSIARETEVDEFLYQYLVRRMRETTLTSSIESVTARQLDEAMASLRPVTPNIPLNLGFGLLGGIGLGIGVAFVVAFLDDRVKSAFDIESIIGLPLLGIMPEVKKLKPEDKVKIAFTGTDRHLVESFRSLHSSLKLGKQSNLAQCVMVTSSIPGEGKSFVSSNLALTHAVNGEKSILVDCDLRMPSVHKSHKLKNDKGVISYCHENLSLDDVIHKDVHPNFDILTTGGKAKNPTQTINSVAFENMIAELRKRYARIIIDTPPLAAVSDGLIILQHTDGALFTLKFNKVRRRAAKHNVRRLMSSETPVFGAVLNHLNISVGGYYYAQYYDRSYRDYYFVKDGTKREKQALPASPDEKSQG